MCNKMCDRTITLSKSENVRKMCEFRMLKRAIAHFQSVRLPNPEIKKSWFGRNYGYGIKLQDFIQLTVLNVTNFLSFQYDPVM